MHIEELGNPPSIEQVKRRKCLHVLLVLLGCSAPLVTVLYLSSFNIPTTLTVMVTLCELIIMFAAWVNGHMTPHREIDGKECEVVAHWKKESAAVKEYVEKVVAHGRELLAYEKDRLERLVEAEQEFAARQVLYAPNSEQTVARTAPSSDEWEQF